MEDLDLLEELRGTSRPTHSALSADAPNPVLSTLKHFRDEYIAHVVTRSVLPTLQKPVDIQKYSQTKCTRVHRLCPRLPATHHFTLQEAPYIDTNNCIKCVATNKKCNIRRVHKGIRREGIEYEHC